MKLVKHVANKYQVYFDKGRIDEWCVFLTREGSGRYAPLDTEYFTFLQNMGVKYGAQKVYNDFVRVYDNTNHEINPNTLTLITQISAEYGTDAEEMDIWLTVIYAGMIAEENKAFAILKKRVKRLGVYQTLIDKIAPEVAAKFSVGKKVAELAPIIRAKGF